MYRSGACVPSKRQPPSASCCNCGPDPGTPKPGRLPSSDVLLRSSSLSSGNPPDWLQPVTQPYRSHSGAAAGQAKFLAPDQIHNPHSTLALTRAVQRPLDMSCSLHGLILPTQLNSPHSTHSSRLVSTHELPSRRRSVIPTHSLTQTSFNSPLLSPHHQCHSAGATMQPSKRTARQPSAQSGAPQVERAQLGP